MMNKNLFQVTALFLMNAFVIWVTWFSRHNVRLEDIGFIHIVSFVFVALLMFRIVSIYFFSDKILREFLSYQLYAFAILALVHILEYLGLHVFDMPADMVELFVILMYVFWLFTVAFSAAKIIWIATGKSGFRYDLSVIPISIAVVVGFLSMWLLLKADVFFLGVYLILTLLISEIFVIYLLMKLKKILPLFSKYSVYVIFASLFVGMASMGEFFEALQVAEKLSLTEYEMILVSHYILYVGLTILFFGISTFAHPEGVYKIQKEE